MILKIIRQTKLMKPKHSRKNYGNHGVFLQFVVFVLQERLLSATNFTRRCSILTIQNHNSSHELRYHTNGLITNISQSELVRARTKPLQLAQKNSKHKVSDQNTQIKIKLAKIPSKWRRGSVARHRKPWQRREIDEMGEVWLARSGHTNDYINVEIDYVAKVRLTV